MPLDRDGSTRNSTNRMKKIIAKLTLVCASCVLLANCGGGDESELEKGEKPPVEEAKTPAPEAKTAVVHPLPGDPEAGKAIYKRICIACHQADGSGMNGMLAADFVKDKTRLAKTNEELLTSIRDGIIRDGKVMPPQKDVLSDGDIKDAISYLRKTFGASASDEVTGAAN